MAMNSREKLLAAGVGVIATLFVGQSVVSSIQAGFDKKKQLIESLEKKKSEQGLQVTAGVVASQKLNKVVARSLSIKEETARAEYMKWLISLGEEAQLDAPTPEGIGDNIEKDGSYQLFKFKLSGTGTIENATQLLYGFYAKDYLHRIVQFSFRPIVGSNEPDQLNISLECEVLALGIAKEKQEPPKMISNRVAKSLDEYKQTILDRNLFGPENQAPKLDPKKSLEAKVGLRFEHTVEAKDMDPKQ